MTIYKMLLVVNPSVGGVEYHRQLIPHYHLYASHKDELEISQCYEIESKSDSFLKQFDLIQFSRCLSYTGNAEKTARRLKKLGIKIMLDIDDYWNLPDYHILYPQYKAHGVGMAQIYSLINADHVTTSTEYLADKVKGLNTNVTVLHNAIDPSQPQFKVEPKTNAKETVRFGWMGGACHWQDVKPLKHSFHLLHTDDSIRNRYQFNLFGYNITPPKSVYLDYEKIFSNYYQCQDTSYKRWHGTNVYSYATGYNEIDVAIAPLINDTFNRCKSQLKLIEAGFMKKTFICSDVLPYQVDGVHKKNCLMVKSSNILTGWYEAMRRCVKSPEMVQDLSDALYETVKVKYHIDTVNDARIQLYRYLLQ
jgi:hypothetical protein